jgi:hypothetical protein
MFGSRTIGLAIAVALALAFGLIRLFARRGRSTVYDDHVTQAVLDRIRTTNEYD